MTREPTAPASGAPDDETVRSPRDSTVPRAREAAVADTASTAGDATALDDGEWTDDRTIRVRRAYAPPPAPATEEDADAGSDAHAASGAGGRVAFRPDDIASEDRSPIRTPAPVVAHRTEHPPTEPQEPLDGGDVGRDIRSTARRRAVTLVVVAAVVMVVAATLLTVLV